MSSSYTSFVESKCARNPSLRILHSFLSTPVPNPCATRIISLEFFSGVSEPMQKEIVPCHLSSEIQGKLRDDKQPAKARLGQILLIEDITKSIMEELGSCLAIDPKFFAAHVHSAWRVLEAPSLKFCELPSRARQQHFATFSYHRSLVFPDIGKDDYKLLRQSNIRRKVIVFPPVHGRRLGLAQHCCSVLMVPRADDEWLGIVLVDPPIDKTYVSFRGQQQMIIQTSSVPLFGGTEDFMPTSYIQDHILLPSRGRCMLEELLYYWRHGRTDDFSSEKLTLGALSYYPLRIIAAEWVNYIELMCFSIQNYDTPQPDGNNSLEDLEKMKMAITTISSWPRRVASSSTSLRQAISFIKRHKQVGILSDNWKDLQKDYEYLAFDLTQHGNQLQAAIPLVTTYLQLRESRGAYLETKNVSRLTVLALVFVPLNFVSSLFSMDSAFSPSGPSFWVYFAVALPILIVVFLVAKPSLVSNHIKLFHI